LVPDQLLNRYDLEIQKIQANISDLQSKTRSIFLKTVGANLSLSDHFKEVAEVYFVRGDAMLDFCQFLFKSLDFGYKQENLVLLNGRLEDATESFKLRAKISINS